MNNQNIIWLLLVLIILVVGYIFFSSASSSTETNITTNTSQQKNSTEEVDMMSDEDKKETDTVVDNVLESGEEMSDEVMVKGTYEAYGPEKLANANTGDVVLFFKASWCPSCRALESDIQKNLESIPEGVTILEINYDTATDLKKKYGVTVQHTLVQVDAEGNLIKKWVNSPTLARVVNEIQ